MAKESGIAKPIGDQKEQDMQSADLLLINFLLTGKKISKVEAGYLERREQLNIGHTKQQESCDIILSILLWTVTKMFYETGGFRCIFTTKKGLEYYDTIINLTFIFVLIF